MMNPQEKLRIANEGGMFEETAPATSWKNKSIRKGQRLGKVIKDMNGRYRELTVLFNDGKKETIVMDNIGSDPDSIHLFEFYDEFRQKWYRF